MKALICFSLLIVFAFSCQSNSKSDSQPFDAKEFLEDFSLPDSVQVFEYTPNTSYISDSKSYQRFLYITNKEGELISAIIVDQNGVEILSRQANSIDCSRVVGTDSYNTACGQAICKWVNCEFLNDCGSDSSFRRRVNMHVICSPGSIICTNCNE